MLGEGVISRATLLRRLSGTIVRIVRDHPARVAIDGVDGAGKTTLADELVPYIQQRGRPVIRASVDGFHQPRSFRYRQGVDSPAGFYDSSFDYAQLRCALLDPLGPRGHRRYRTAVFDWRADQPVQEPEQEAPNDAVLLFDGIFAQRPELEEAWDFVIFLKVNFGEALRRSQIRDLKPGQSSRELERRFWIRYAAGQRLYLACVGPSTRANVVIDNNDPMRPRLLS